MAATAGTALAAGAGSALLGDALRDDPPEVPSPPSRTTRQLGPDRKVVRERTPEGNIVERTVLSEEAQAEQAEREQMVDELFAEIPTTGEERQQQFQEAKSAFMEEFETDVGEQFEQQDQQLRASQTATGRQLSSVGAQEQQDLNQAQQEQIAGAARDAEQMRQQLVDREQQRNLQLIQNLRQGLNTDVAQQQQALNSANRTANTVFSNAMAANQAQRAATQAQNQARIGDITTGATLGTSAQQAGMFDNLWGGGGQAQMSGNPAGVQQGSFMPDSLGGGLA